MSGPGRALRDAVSGQLERELAYYQRECNDLGARLLRLQEEQSQAFREARRSRTVAKLIREIHRLADTGLGPEELASPILEVIVENAICDGAAILVEEPLGSGRFALGQSIGLGEPPPEPIFVPGVPTFFLTTSQTPLEPPAYELTAILRLPYILWAYDRSSGYALIIGNRSEANISRAFEPGDQELIEGALSVYLDVLARKRGEMQLREAKEAAEAARREAEEARAVAELAARAKSDFLAAMSHEIRTPMTSVLGMADLLANDGLGERHHHYVQTIRASGRHLLALINDILDFSRIESGRLELEHIDFSLESLCAEVRTLLAQQAEDHGLDLAFDVSSDVPPMVRGDPTRVRQMLLNLVGNALKFTRDGSVRVGVGSSPLGERHVCVRLEVRDTGIGIPLDRQAGLFEPFSQAETSTMRRYGGTGLGLAICRRLTDAMGGAIGLESVPGEGSLFWIEIPLEIGEAMLDARPSAVNGAAVIPLRVLVVDDVWTNRELLGAMLGQQGHEVLFAEDGAEAVRLVGEEHLDLVLMDVRMPVLDGVEATRRIRAMSTPACSVPILGLTANIMEDEHRRYVSAGMDMILTKPVVWPDLFAVMAAVAEGRGSASPRAAS